MKFLIWFLCILANSIITTIIKEAGVILGAIPTVILFGATMWLAKTLCKKWDEHKENKDTAKKAQTQPVPQPAPVKPAASQPASQIPVNDKICFCRKCGSKLMDDAAFCNKCGTQVIKE